MQLLINLSGTSTYIGKVASSSHNISLVNAESFIMLILEEIKLTHNLETITALVSSLNKSSYTHLSTAPNFKLLALAVTQLPSEEQTLFNRFSSQATSPLKLNAVYSTPAGTKVYISRPKLRPVHPSDPVWLNELKTQHQESFTAYRLSDGHHIQVDFSTLRPV